MNEWLIPGLLQVHRQERRSEFRCNTAKISFLFASGNLPAEVLTPANYAYISVDCVNLWLPVSDYYSSRYKVHIAEHGLYFPFDTYKIHGELQEKEKQNPPKQENSR